MPPHILNLKVGAIVMLLRNLNVKQGLCNGVRLSIISIESNRLLKCRIITGSHKNE
jgi:hypothetical protein